MNKNELLETLKYDDRPHMADGIGMATKLLGSPHPSRARIAPTYVGTQGTNRIPFCGMVFPMNPVDEFNSYCAR